LRKVITGNADILLLIFNI